MTDEGAHGENDLLRAPLPDEPPPFFRRWRSVYILVLTYLAALIALFYVFARLFDA